MSEKLKVGINSVKGRLRLVWSHAGQRYFFSLKLDDPPVNRSLAQRKALDIHLDLISGNFNPTLDKYRPDHERNVQMLVGNLLKRYSTYKARWLDPRTLERHRAVVNHVEQYFGLIAINLITDKRAAEFTKHILGKIEPSTYSKHLIFCSIAGHGQISRV